MTMAMRILGGAVVSAGSYNLWTRFTDDVKGSDSFSLHSRNQHRKHWISGMHEPYIPNAAEQATIEARFPQFRHLIPFSKEEINTSLTLKSPVQFKYLSQCPINPQQAEPGNIVVVGGPPALFSTAFEKGITYINDGRRPPIAYGSALHLEWDAESEAPTSSQPRHFMIDQFKRLIFPEFLATAEQTGHFSWKSLDWVSWIQHPSKWMVGVRIAIAFQRFTQSGPHPEVVAEVAARTRRNEHFYYLLNKELDEQLMMPGQGSIYIARTSDEREGLINMQKSLIKERREFPLLSNYELIEKFGYLPQGTAFAEKTHDRTLSPRFLTLLSNRIVQNGGQVINGSVTAVYTDDPDQGGIVEYRTNHNDEIHYIHCKKLVMSLGTQQPLGVDGAPLFDIVAARGVSAIALVHLPQRATLPPAVVCGGTNHLTKLAEFSDPLNKSQVFLVRMTCGACIAPTSDSADYDGSAAVGMMEAVSKVLKGRVEVLTVYGCNRQVSQYGQIHWLKVSETLKATSGVFMPRGSKEDVGSSLPKADSGMFVAYGMGGGGLTQGPSQ